MSTTLHSNLLKPGQPQPSVNFSWRQSATNQCGHSGPHNKENEDFGTIKRAAIRYIEVYRSRQNATPNVFEIGCGDGTLAIRMVQAGAAVVVCDLIDNLQPAAKELCRTGKMVAHIQPAEKIKWEQIPQTVNGVVAERSLHWLPFKQARYVLCKVGQRMPLGSPLLFSLAGLDSSLGETYRLDGRTPISKRYDVCKTNSDNFSHKCTLYSGSEAARLVEDTGLFAVRSLKQTDWGLWNVKAVRCG